MRDVLDILGMLIEVLIKRFRVENNMNQLFFIVPVMTLTLVMLPLECIKS